MHTVIEIPLFFLQIAAAKEMANAMMQQFVAGLKSRNEEVRLKSARDLHHYVTIYIQTINHER